MKDVCKKLVEGTLSVDEAVRLLAVQMLAAPRKKKVKEHQIGTSEPGDPPTSDAPQSTNAIG